MTAPAKSGHLRIRVRRATLADKAAVLEFTREVWGGHDYLPVVWESWLGARDGVVLAAEAVEGPGRRRGRPIAVARVTLLSRDEAWIEGLRVDAVAQGRGVATAFQVAELAWAQAQGAAIARYATGELNDASLRLGARHGFSPAGRWRAMRPPGPPSSPARPRQRSLEGLAGSGAVASGDDAREWLPRLQRDATFVRSGGLYEWRAWAWQAVDGERLTGHAARGELLAATGRGRWALGLLAHERLAGEVRIVLLGGATDPALELVGAVATAAGRQPALRLPDPSPLFKEMGPRLRAAGWTIGEHAVVLLTRPLVDERGAPLPLPEEGAERLELAEPPRPLGLVPAG